MVPNILDFWIDSVKLVGSEDEALTALSLNRSSEIREK